MKNLIFALMLLVLTSCASTVKTVEVPVEVPVEVVKHHYLYAQDTVIVRDSIYYEVTQRADTVYANKYVYKTKLQVSHDTVSTVDSIPVFLPVEKTVVTNELSWWQKILMWVGGAFIGLIAVKVVLSKINII